MSSLVRCSVAAFMDGSGCNPGTAEAAKASKRQKRGATISGAECDVLRSYHTNGGARDKKGARQCVPNVQESKFRVQRIACR